METGRHMGIIKNNNQLLELKNDKTIIKKKNKEYMSIHEAILNCRRF